MAFKKVSPRKYFKYSECSVGQVLVAAGTFVGCEEGKFGIQHIFKLQDGSTVCLNSAAHLNYLVEENLVPGSIANVIYDGTDTQTKGAFKGKMYHKFDMEVDDAPITPEASKAAKEVEKDTADVTL